MKKDYGNLVNEAEICHSHRMDTAKTCVDESADLKSLCRPIDALSPGQIPAHMTK
ncbi:hypothetical protein EV13_2883 [Prochlorococcus sp. MIT 0702]|nr:hypothetical protein EV12_2829 [Prochlorococcus sp. MIT 0701]KGG26103.1 hypothetical protein EV13_2883 [Prochlorococcus sp. MIT 0702]KGG30724.1 hypothetical protein EV14_2656 [Prochlorococcus sp. MIT 0703]